MAQIDHNWPQIGAFKGENSAQTAQNQKNMEGYLSRMENEANPNGLAKWTVLNPADIQEGGAFSTALFFIPSVASGWLSTHHPFDWISEY